MSVKEKFIRDLISELNDINENRITYENKHLIDVCRVISVIDQQLENCKEFLDDITDHAYHINGYEESNGFTHPRIRIFIEKNDSEKDHEYIEYYDQHNYCYYIEFTNDERYSGYCECTPNDSGYNEKYGCCGRGCDWVAPAFSLEKSINLGGRVWKGQERDYWKYKDKFNRNEQNKNDEVEKYQLEEQRKNIKSQIAELKKKLEELE